MKIPLIVPGFLASALFVVGALPTAAQAQIVHVRAWIDGRSDLILSGANVQWQHFDFAAPGRLNCDTGTPEEPTYLDANVWFPLWPDVPTCENRFCGGCFSDAFAGIAPPLPASDFFARLVPLQNRGDLSVIEQPHAANGYRTVVNFNDNAFGGGDWYEFDLYVEMCFADSYCTSSPCSSGFPATLELNGTFSVSTGYTTMSVYKGPVTRPGIFFCGAGPAKMPMANGTLCIDPFSGLHRMQPAWTGPDGYVNDYLDFNYVPILPDSTWYFQYWFRDPAGGGTGSNLTNAVRARFCP